MQSAIYDARAGLPTDDTYRLPNRRSVTRLGLREPDD
jgi:hypothetical protein